MCPDSRVHLRLVFLLGVLLCVLSCGRDEPAHGPVDRQVRSSPDRPLEVSLIRIIADPDAFDGEYVRVQGFYRYEFEGTAIYVHRADYEHALYRNGLWVTSGPDLDQQYVLLEGRFSAARRGHLGLWSGSIEDVTRMIPWPPKVARPAR